jgi:peroxiredoxin
LVSARNRWIGTGVAVAIAVAILVPMFRSDRPSSTGPSALAGTTAPVFEMRDARGSYTSLASYRGKIVVMNLWASWCPPCRAEMPDLQRFQEAYARYNVAVLGVNEGESTQRASAFAKSLRISFPIWVDADQKYGRLYETVGLPTTVIIGADGVVREGIDGPLTYAQMQAAVAPFVRKT